MVTDMDLFRDFGMPRRSRFFDDLLEEASVAVPKCEVKDEDDHYVVCCEIPGVSQENIKLEVTGDTLHISAQKDSVIKGKRKGSETEEHLHYEQIFTLPNGVNADAIEADYKNGILYIAVPKGEAVKSKSITLGTEKGGLLSRLKNKVTEAIEGKPAAEKKSKAA